MFFFNDILKVDDKKLINDIKQEVMLINYNFIEYYKKNNGNKIVTMHSSKGLESENVVVVIDEYIENFSDEFRKLLFVSFTRAKEKLFIYFNKNNKNKISLKEKFLNLLNQK